MSPALTRRSAAGLIVAAAAAGSFGCSGAAGADARTLLNASYDSTRELYEAVNAAFRGVWLARSGRSVRLLQSHGGSGQQAAAIINGLPADVATLGSSFDVMQLYRRAHLIPENWAQRLPDDSCPYTSTIVFLVRQGNPKNITDWSDLVRPGVQVVTANPKTSGAGRWTYLAAWAWASRNGGGEASTRSFMRMLYEHVPVLDSGSRGATDTFIERGIGDVLLSWENEALLAVRQLGDGRVALIVPSLSILAEPPVTLIDVVVDRKGTRALAEAYLHFLYTPQGQRIIAQNYYRPRDPVVAREYAAQFGQTRMVSVEKAFGGWARANAIHFADGGTFDQIYGG